MSETTVKTANWRLVELGRVVLLKNGKLATIVEIIDHKRVLIDGPKTGVPRQGVALAQVTLTPHVIPNIARAMGTTAVGKKWEASGIDAKWAASAWAQKIERRNRRRELTDFERFQVLVLKKQRRYAVNKAVAKA
ncbi:large ribosomal subunit protein eL14B [Trichomonascus vanleenenianus]|uniref:60S ribosomal protein eL14 RPL14A n=1 Tax=Trichomonascus vanleenenianus TaxID=2268995 RepID=UPI003EC9806B